MSTRQYYGNLCQIIGTSNRNATLLIIYLNRIWKLHCTRAKIFKHIGEEIAVTINEVSPVESLGRFAEGSC